MIQYQDNPWRPCPTPLPDIAPADLRASFSENDQAAPSPTAPERQTSSPPVVFPDDDYQWMVLL
jgi:hypothetical protein